MWSFEPKNCGIREYRGRACCCICCPDATQLSLRPTGIQHKNDWQPEQVYGPSDMDMWLNGGTRIHILSIDEQGKKARILIRRVAKHPFVAGPGTVFGGVSVDGGGWIILNGRVIRIPPNSPLLAVTEAIADTAAAQVEIESSLNFRSFAK